ncbi:sugar O-acyltransferase, sialic acid O-acetyltransferase NeuD family [Modestobacter sp. DSM 44400]|uniref:acetyltransferase n=1 Tax=Modestobacter sp. DSM 44400 TaxID=1550230 RepID=UPI00089716FB|nr:acetyltransferase [Modestobacter sp. DSM 44400]SDY75570.1 sugar O-acyltransferase, sialic acid O-acetyltransferase NeuD family [Modestobacter sp. DSM 44400]
MTSTPLVVIGSGGFGREVHDVIEAVNAGAAVQGRPEPWAMLGFLDDGNPDRDLLVDRGTPFLGPSRTLLELPADVQYVVGIGSGPVRRRLDEWATAAGRTAATLVHPAAVLGRHGVHLGAGTIVCASAVITTNVRVGRHVHLNLGVTVGHDAVLGDYVTANPNVSISGNTVIEDEVNLGTGSAVIQGRHVGARTVVGACAAVVRDLPPDVTAVGVPARPRS